MYAIIETGSKQYRIEEGSKIVVEKLACEAGSEITLDRVLMLGGPECRVGTPYLPGVAVTAEVVEHGRGPKIKVFKRWRRNDSRKLRGHRQENTTLLVKNINLG
ncbi:MAG: 50S ribosomal protein L21 [Desulfovibrio sp.]|nr:50S ribosomal protein L21 [Desulfovibrio sp.]